MRLSTRLRRMLDEPEIVVLPGAYDALSARLAERAGFQTCFTTGFGFAATVLGMPPALLKRLELRERFNPSLIDRLDAPLVVDSPPKLRIAVLGSQDGRKLLQATRANHLACCLDVPGDEACQNLRIVSGRTCVGQRNRGLATVYNAEVGQLDDV